MSTPPTPAGATETPTINPKWFLLAWHIRMIYSFGTMRTGYGYETSIEGTLKRPLMWTRLVIIATYATLSLLVFGRDFRCYFNLFNDFCSTLPTRIQMHLWHKLRRSIEVWVKESIGTSLEQIKLIWYCQRPCTKLQVDEESDSPRKFHVQCWHSRGNILIFRILMRWMRQPVDSVSKHEWAFQNRSPRNNFYLTNPKQNSDKKSSLPSPGIKNPFPSLLSRHWLSACLQ